MDMLSNIAAISITMAMLIARPAKAQSGNETSEKKITISTQTVRLDSLLKIFSRQTGMEFSFNPSKISSSKTIVVPKQKQTLSQWLTILQQRTGIQYKLVGNHIILVDSVNQPPTAQKNKALQEPQKILISKERDLHRSGLKSDPQAITAMNPTQIKTRSTTVQIPEPLHTTDIQTPATKSKPDTSYIAVKKPSQPETNAGEQNKGGPDNVSSPNPKSSNSTREIRQKAANDLNKSESIQLVGGYSRHGSGDLNGIIFGAEYLKYLSGRFLLDFNIRATINDGKDEIIVNNTTTGTKTDASLRYTTAGVQIGVNGGLSIFKNMKHEFIISLGAFGRYQSASNGSDGYSFYSPQATGLPVALIGFDNRTPQETFSLGGILQLQYHFTIKNNIYIGILPGFQTDTNGDAIPQIALTLGRRL